MPAFFTYTIVPSLTLTIRRETGITIHDAADTGGKDAAVTVNTEPPIAAPFTITDPATTTRLFGGIAQQRTQSIDLKRTQLAWALRGTDWRWLLNRRRPIGAYVNTSATDVALDLMDAFTAGFTTDHVQTGLPSVSITFDGRETMTQALDRLGRQSSCRARLDYFKDLHFYYVAPPELPRAVLPDGPTTPLTVSEGPTASSVTPGKYLFRYAWEWADGQVSAYSPISNLIDLSGTKTWQFDDLTVGPDLDGMPCVARRIWLTAGGSAFGRLDQIAPLVRVIDNTTTSLEYAFAVDGVVTAEFHVYGRTVRQPAVRPAAPSALVVTQSASVYPVDPVRGTFTFTPGNYAFRMSYVYEDDVESYAGPASNTVALDGSHMVDFSSASLGAPVAGVPVKYRKIYAALAFTGTPTFDAGGVIGWILINDNTRASFNDTFTYSLNEWGFVPAKLPPAALALGPDLEAADAPEPITDANPALLYDPPPTVTTDISLIRNRVYVRGTGSALDVAAGVGATGLHVADITRFFPGGGQVYIGGSILTYNSFAGSALVLAEPLDDAFPLGTPVQTWVQRDDVDSQAWLAELEDGDGVHETVIDDTSLTTLDALEDRGDAELVLGGKPSTTVVYGTRNVKTASGKMQEFDLTDPPIAGTFRIQQVSIDQIGIDRAGTLAPRFTATASTDRFTLEDLFQQPSADGAGFGGGFGGTPGSGSAPAIPGFATVANRLAPGAEINGVLFTGAADISVDPLPGSITNAMVSATAAIAYSKLALSGAIVNGDIVSLAWSKLTGTPTTLAGYGITDPIVLTSGTYADPAWITSLAGSKVTGAALTKADDTNVTLTLGGTPGTALLRAASLTLGWSGTLAPVRGGVGADVSAVAKGWLIVGTAAGAFGLKAVGTDGQVLTADSTVAGGVKWAAAGGGTITGSGTTGKLAQWSSSSALTDGPTVSNVALLGAANVFTAQQTISLTGGTSFASGDQVKISSASSGKRAELHLTDGITSDAFISFFPSSTGATRYVSVDSSGTEQGLLVYGTGNATLAGVLTVSGLGTHTFSVGGTGANALSVRNTTAGTGNLSLIYAGTDVAAQQAMLVAYSSTYNTGTYDQPSGSALIGNTSGGLSVAALHASGPLRLYAGGTTERWRVTPAGDWAEGPSAHIVDSSGTPSISSGFGSGSTVSGTDHAMKVSTGTGVNSGGVIAFGHTFNNSPACVAQSTNGNAAGVKLSSTTTALTITYNSTASSDTLHILVRGF